MKDNYEYKPNRFDELTYDLCAEIDDLRRQVTYWREKFEEERNERSSLLNSQLETAKQGVANALMFALSVKDDANGNLIIDRESRKQLAENYKNV